MTSNGLFFKLLMEDLRRRAWAAALALVVFFFSLPVALALVMEKTVNSRSIRLDGYVLSLADLHLSKAELAAKILEAREQAALGFAGFGNGFMALLMILGAVVMGLSSFAYLHSRKKVDFYHSLPVRRELLYGVQFAGGLLIFGGAYLLNVLFMLGVSCAYGVPLGTAAGAALFGWLANMLFFLLMYAVTVVSVMLTGNLVVSILGDAVLFFFFPVMLFAMEGYCDTFFKTYFSWGGGLHFADALKWSSPIAAYLYVIAENSRLGMVLSLLAALAAGFLGLELYRLRPSEAAGRAMAFGRTKAAIRLILAVGSGLLGGLFFWAVQSRTFWAVFGAVAGAALAHCVIEIIYHFDFKKLFSHRLQMGFSVAAAVFVVLAFRYDWWGYDSWIPEKGQVKSAAVSVDVDGGWLDGWQIKEEDGKLTREYVSMDEAVMERMELTRLEPVLALAAQGKAEALEERAGQWEEGFPEQEDGEGIPSRLTVTYTMNSGRKASRAYPLTLDLEDLGAYGELFADEAYKEGLYSILGWESGSVVRAEYGEGGQVERLEPAAQGYDALLAAYQKDLRALSAGQRAKENPVGWVRFVSAGEKAYLDQLRQQERERGIEPSGHTEARRFSQAWPVYPSFEETLKVLRDMGARPGEMLDASQIRSVSITVSGQARQDFIEEGQELEQIYYGSGPDGDMTLEDKEEIGLVLEAFAQDEAVSMNGLCPVVPGIYLYLNPESGEGEVISGVLQENRVTPQIREMLRRAGEGIRWGE